MHTREDFQKALPIHQHFSLSFDQIHHGRRCLSLPATSGSTHRIYRRGFRFTRIGVSGTNVGLHGLAHILGENLRVNLTKSLQNPEKASVLFRRHGLANHITELRQFEPGRSGCFMLFQCWQGRIVSQQSLHMEQMIDKLGTAREVRGGGRDNPGRSGSELGEINRGCCWRRWRCWCC